MKRWIKSGFLFGIVFMVILLITACGDEELKELIKRLNGKKILIKGNHDVKRGINEWKSVGFSEVYRKKLILGRLVLTHEPIHELDSNQINVFGHIHNKPLDESFDKSNHICVSCDVIDYTPIQINEKLMEK